MLLITGEFGLILCDEERADDTGMIWILRVASTRYATLRGVLALLLFVNEQERVADGIIIPSDFTSSMNVPGQNRTRLSAQDR